jgi:hypothetical protein
MSLLSLLGSMGGFDRNVLGDVPHATRKHFAFVSVCLVGLTIVDGMSVAYAASLATDSRVVSLSLGLASGWMALTLIRLTSSGGGIPLSVATEEEVRRWRPSWAPQMFLFAFTLLLAYPALLWSDRARLDPLIDQERQTLLSYWNEAETARESRLTAIHEREVLAGLRANGFLGTRIALEWSGGPQSRARLFLLAVALGAVVLLRRYPHARLLPYYYARWERSRALVLGSYEAATIAADLTLQEGVGAFGWEVPSLPPGPFLDPPFNAHRRPHSEVPAGIVENVTDLGAVLAEVARNPSQS